MSYGSVPKKTRHTTYVEDPRSVRISRPRHPFEGQELQVFSQKNTKEGRYFILVLPDGSRSLVPVEWTDWKDPKATSSDHVTGSTGVLAKVTDHQRS